MSVLVSLPLKFVRQQAEPLDVDTVFTTTADRTAYLSSPRRYAGQVVADLETVSAFMLNAARNAWVPIGGGGGSFLLTNYTPTSLGDPFGSPGQMVYDENYLYLKTPVGWKRTVLGEIE